MTAHTLKSLNIARLAHKQRVGHIASAQVFADAAMVAAQLNPEMPVLCFSPSRLAESVRAFLDGFPGRTTYAVKSNASAEVLTTIAHAGIETFDVASCDEMAAVRAVKPQARFHYHNPVKSRAEIDAAYSAYGCRRFAADYAGEIAKVRQSLPEARDVEIAVRFRLPTIGASAHDFSTKFGATPGEAVDLLKQARALGFAVTLTFHPGSQCTNPTAWRRHITAAAGIAAAAGVELSSLNVGGGFPAVYAKTMPVPRRAIFETIARAAAEAFPAESVPALECEPGRGIVAPSQSVLTRVKLVKPERGELFINDGIYGTLLEVSQTPEVLPPHRAIRPLGTFEPDTTGWIVYGPTCDPLDVLPVKLQLPGDIREGDYIEFGNIGAYGTATCTSFNGYGKFERARVERVLDA